MMVSSRELTSIDGDDFEPIQEFYSDRANSDSDSDDDGVAVDVADGVAVGDDVAADDNDANSLHQVNVS